MFVHRFLPIVVLLSFAGCLAVHEARRAQEEVAPRGVAAPSASGRIDLRAASLSELVDFALTNRPSVASAALAVDDARLAMRALAADAPVLSDSPLNALHASANIGHSASSATAQHLDSLSSKTDGSASGSLSVDLLLWDFGRYDARVRAQAERVLAAELSFLETSYTVFREVCSAYFSVLEKDALFAVAQSNECEYAEHLQQAEERLAAGEARDLDVLRAKLDLAAAMESTVAAANDMVTAGAELMNVLGVDASRGGRRDALVPLDDPVGHRRRAFADTADVLEEAFASARTNAPAMRVARARLRAASADVDYAIADLLPEIKASLSLDWTDPRWYWRWGVNGVQSLLTGGRRATAIDRASVAMRSAAVDVDAAEQSLSLSLSLALAERDNARTALKTTEASVRQAHENLDTVREQVGLGDASRVDYASAVAALTTALGNRVKAFYRGQVAEAKLFALVGRPPEYSEETIVEESK